METYNPEIYKEYCPDCVVELKKDSKKLGQNSVWMVCPNCGFRKRPENWFAKINYHLDSVDYKEKVKREIEQWNEDRVVDYEN